MQFTPEHAQLSRHGGTSFVENEINPYVDSRMGEGRASSPRTQVFKKLGDLGLLGLKYPEEFGGAGAGLQLLDGDGRGAGHCYLRRRAHGHWRADRYVHPGAGALWQ